jgi:hypothetical protein
MTIAIKRRGVLHVAEIKTPCCKNTRFGRHTYNVLKKWSTKTMQNKVHLVKIILARENFPILGLYALFESAQQP